MTKYLDMHYEEYSVLNPDDPCPLTNTKYNITVDKMYLY